MLILQEWLGNSKILAEALNLPEEDVKLAQAIGYFHDIGRFEQVRIADTFSDKESGINHGELSVKVLFENDFIRNFIPDSKYDEIIKVAVLNHNKKAIDKNLNDRELLFSKIIRDADKLDILYNIGLPENTMESIFWYPEFDCEKINEKILAEFKNSQPVSYSMIKNNADVIVIFYAYIFDINFKSALQIISDNKYLDKFTVRVLDTFKSPIIHNQVKEISEFTNNCLSSILS